MQYKEPLSRKALWALLVGVWLSISLTVMSAQAQPTPVKYSQVRVHIVSKDDILALAKAGVTVDNIDYQGNYFDVALNDHEVSTLRATGWRYDVLVDDLEAAYQKRPKMSATEQRTLERQMGALYATPGNFHLGSMGGYLTLEEVATELDSMRALYPNLISVKQSIGTSIEGRQMWGCTMRANRRA